MDPMNKEPKFDVDLTPSQGVQIGDHGQQTNIFQLFGNAEPSLSTQIRSNEFRTLVEERTRNFVGRDFIFNAIDDAIRDDSFPSATLSLEGSQG
jgi:hypothetical protein